MEWRTLLKSNRAIRKADGDINIPIIIKKNISDQFTNKEKLIGMPNFVADQESMKSPIAGSFLHQPNATARGMLPFIEGKARNGIEITNKGNQGLDKANSDQVERLSNAARDIWLESVPSQKLKSGNESIYRPSSSIDEGGLADAFQPMVDAVTKSPSFEKGIVRSSRETESTPVSMVENFFGGMGDAVESTAEGLWNLATHPIDAVQDLGHAIAHPIDTGAAIYDNITDSFAENVIDGDADTRARFAGRAIGELGLGVVGTKGLDKAVKAIKVGENVAEAAEVVGKGSSNAVKPRKPRQPNQKNWEKNGGTVKRNKDGSVTYTNKDGQSVKYRNGYPDFSPYAHPTVKAVEIKVSKPTNRKVDFREANKKAELDKNSNPPVPASDKPPKGYTWHHHEDGKTIILVDKKIHDQFKHTGGVATVKNGK